MSRLPGGFSTISVPNPAGGISQQPHPLRFPGQVTTATNVVSNLADGLSKRPGTRFLRRITGLTAGNSYRIHTIERDETERYVLVHGVVGANYTIQLYTADGVTSCSLSGLSGDVQAYLNSGSPTPDDIRIRTIQDTTFIVNRKVTTACGTSAQYAVTGSARNFGILSSRQPANNSYWRTEEDDEFAPKGYYQYLATDQVGTPANVVYGQWRTSALSGQWGNTTGYTTSGQDIGGFRIFYQHTPMLQTSCSWDASTRRLTKTGVFSLYTVQAGDQIYLTGGGHTVGYYTISSKISDDTIELAAATGLSGTNNNTTTTDGIGRGAEVALNFKGKSFTDMHDIAKVFENAIADAGIVGATVYWDYESSTSGRFTFVGPYAGTNGSVKEPIAPTTTPGTGYDYSASTRPLATGTETAGSGVNGGSLYQLPDARWTRVSAPAQPNALPTATTLPLILTRESANNFRIALAPWKPRTSGDDDSNPAPRPLDGQQIEDVCLFNNRLAILAGPWIALSSSEDVYDFWIQDAANLVESDRIVLPLGDDRSAKGQRLLPLRRTLIIFTSNGRQFELYADKALTPTTAAITPSTSDVTQNVAPVLMGNAAYYVTSLHERSAIAEYPYTDGVVATRSTDLTSWVPDLLPSTIRTIAADNDTGTLFILPTAGSTVHTYKAFYSGERKELSAWTTWTYQSSNTIRDIAAMGGDLYFFVETPTSGQWVLERSSANRERNESGLTFPVHLDRMMTITGVHSAGTTTWTLPSSLNDNTINRVVLGSAFGASTGTEVVVSGSGTTVTASGNFAAGSAYVGRTYTAEIVPSRPFRREDGRSILTDRMQISDVHIHHRATGQYTVTKSQSGFSNRSSSYAATAGTIDDFGYFRVTMPGDSDNYSLSIADTSARPMTIVGIDYTVRILPHFANGTG